jgi:putative Holliday junction resolvase
VRSGRRLSIDVGKVRIGIAASDFHGILASGVSTIARGKDLSTAIDGIKALISEIEPIEIYVGLPISMSGNHTESTRDALNFARVLNESTDVEIRLIDERLSTSTASAALRSSGRDSKSGRQIIDQIAATVILEQALELEKSLGGVPGLALGEIDG